MGFAKERSLRVGSSFVVRNPERQPVRLTVRGTLRDRGQPFGDALVAVATLRDRFGAHTVLAALIASAPGAPEDQVRAELAGLLDRDFPTLEPQTRAEFIDAQVGQVSQILYVFYALLALSVILALFGVLVSREAGHGSIDRAALLRPGADATVLTVRVPFIYTTRGQRRIGRGPRRGRRAMRMPRRPASTMRAARPPESPRTRAATRRRCGPRRDGPCRGPRRRRRRHAPGHGGRGERRGHRDGHARARERALAVARKRVARGPAPC